MVVNIILNPIFISGLGLGAAGSAIATVIGYSISDVYFVWFLKRRSRCLSINPKLFRVTIHEMSQILAVGLPASVTNLMQSLGIVMVNWYLLAYGTTKVAAMGIVTKVNLIAVLILIGFAFGAQPLIGYNYGAKNYARLKQVLRFCFVFECSLALIITVLLWFFAPAMMHLFMNNQEIVVIGTSMLRMQLISMFFVTIVLITTCTFQSAGKAFSAFLVSVSRQGIVLAVVLAIASKFTGYDGIIAAQAISDFLTAGIAILLFYTGVHREIKEGLVGKSR
jgi:Na+-driven multidrug efflux pump